MQIRKPIINDENLIRKYVKEHYESGEKEIHASKGLTTMSFNEWIESLIKSEKTPDKDWGISETYIAEENGVIVGMLNIRYNPKKEIKEIYGNIGYGVLPSERRKGIATKLLQFALKKCKEKGLKDVVLGCYKDNIASAKTIKKNGGVLYKECLMEYEMAQYYIIKL